MKPLKWHGGKNYLAKKIIGIMPEHTHYLEAYAGGLSVLFMKNPNGVSEYANDLNGDLMNFWRVLRVQKLFEQFKRQVEAIPLGKPMFEMATHYEDDFDEVTRAVLFFIRFRQSRQGLGTSYATPTKRTRGGMNENVSAWLTAVDGLQAAHERLRRVEVFNEEAVQLIRRLDHGGMLVYCDPPYMSQTRSSPDLYGKYEMKYDDHERLLNCLAEMKGKFILSGYESKLYNEYAESYRWDRIEIEIPNSSSSKKVKDIKKECLWVNYAI